VAQTRANIDEFLGHTINGQYHLLKSVGVGGMGGVYLAENLKTKEKLAVKLMHPDRQQKETLAKRFVREAQISSLLKHPNTISVYDYGSDPDTGALYLAMEYLDGKTLYRYVRERQQLDFHAAAYITTNILASLGNAHENGIIHRDLKPGNVMIMERPGQPNMVKVLDFGIAKIHDPGALGSLEKRMTALTQFGEMLGTPHYMPPEQIRGQELAASADLYALGVIFFFMITGRRPFEDKEGIHVTIAQLTQPFPRLSGILSCVGYPVSVQEFLDRIVKKEPKERFQNAKEMSERLAQILATIPQPQQAPTGTLRTPPSMTPSALKPTNAPKLPLPPPPSSQYAIQAIRNLVPQANTGARPALPLPSPLKPNPLKPPSGNQPLVSKSFPLKATTPVPAPKEAPALTSNELGDLFDNEQATSADGAYTLNLYETEPLGDGGTVPGIESPLDLRDDPKSDEDPLAQTMQDSFIVGRALPPLPPLPKPVIKTQPTPQPPEATFLTITEPKVMPAVVKEALTATREQAAEVTLNLGPPTVSDAPSPLKLAELAAPNPNPVTAGAALSIAFPPEAESESASPERSPVLRWFLLLLLFMGLAGAGAASTYFIIQSIRPPALIKK
jgi:serine/threonine protein kinase